MRDIEKVCEAEFETFSKAISKMGFDPQGFAFAMLLDKKNLRALISDVDGFSLTTEERSALFNRLELFNFN
jgi:hypothetical protein